MRGHEALIAMRRKGRRPGMAIVWCGRDALRSWSTWGDETPQTAHLEVADDEPLAGVDMRCVVGMLVVVQGDSERRVMSVYRRCLENGARRVLAAFPGRSGWECVEGVAQEEAEAA